MADQSASHSQALAGHLDVDHLSAFLRDHGVEHEIVEHEETVTAAEGARAVAVPLPAAAKTVVLTDRGAYFLAVVPASDFVDLHKVRSILGAGGSLRLASEEEMATHFPEFEVGAVPPVGLGVFAGQLVDRQLLTHSRVLCSSADHRHGVLLDPHELERLSGAVVADICAE
jgi:Ala-tRNA(Pro) deacylase